MALSLIAAVASNGVIGIANRLPWQLPADLQHFKALTMGHAVIMGRKTWESLPDKFRPLPGRHNIVVTRNAAYRAAGASVAGSLPAAVAGAGPGLVFVIGGAELYRAALPMAERLHLTEIDAAFEGDSWFPQIDRRQWREVARQAQQDAGGLVYAFVTYERTQPGAPDAPDA